MKPKGSGGTFNNTKRFRIKYMMGAEEHKFLNKFKICALKSVGSTTLLMVYMQHIMTELNFNGDGIRF